MSRVPLSLLQQFVHIARLGNLSRAADQANLTVSALSHQMRQLEERLERRLFERGPRGVSLTARPPTDDEILALHQRHAPTPEAFDLVYTHCVIVCGIASLIALAFVTDRTRDEI